MLSLILRLVILPVVPDALCTYLLTCNILVGQFNKIFGPITHIIKILHGLYCMVFKNVFSWCDTNSKLESGLNGGIKKIS